MLYWHFRFEKISSSIVENAQDYFIDSFSVMLGKLLNLSLSQYLHQGKNIVWVYLDSFLVMSIYVSKIYHNT